MFSKRVKVISFVGLLLISLVSAGAIIYIQYVSKASPATPTPQKETDTSKNNWKAGDKSENYKVISVQIPVLFSRADLSTKTLAIGEIRTVESGKESKSLNEKDGEYSLEGLNSLGKTVTKVAFSVGLPPTPEPPKEGEVINSQNTTEPTAMPLYYNLKWSKDVQKIVINKGSSLVTEKAMTSATYFDNRNEPGFEELKGEDQISQNSEGFIKKASAHGGYFHVAIIGDDFSSDDISSGRYTTAVNTTINGFKAVYPYKSQFSQMVFTKVNNTADLGCKYAYNSTEGRNILSCNYNTAWQKIVNAGAAWDKMMIIYDYTASDGEAHGIGGGDYAVVSMGTYRDKVIVHEMTHALGVTDEYIRRNYNGTSSTAMYNYACYTGTNPGGSTSWTPPVGTYDYALGCYYKNWYRSYSNTMMNNHRTASWLSVLAQQRIHQFFLDKTGTKLDTTVPSLTINYPTSGQTISGTYHMDVTASDTSGIERVEYWMDGRLRHAEIDMNDGGDYYYPTTKIANGSHTVTVKAYDGWGNVKSVSRTFSVKN